MDFNRLTETPIGRRLLGGEIHDGDKVIRPKSNTCAARLKDAGSIGAFLRY
jgi:hypothetical protein